MSLFHVSSNPPTAIRVLSVAHLSSLYILKETLRSLLCCLASLGRFSSFLGGVGHCLVSSYGSNCFCVPLSCVRFDLIESSLYLLKPHGFADNISEPAREPLLFILFAAFYYFILLQVIKRWSLVNVNGTIKSSLTHFCELLSIYPLQINLVGSLHILGHLEVNSEFLFCEKGAKFSKQIKLLEDCAQGFLVFVVALYSSKTFSASIVSSFNFFYNSRHDQNCEKASRAPSSVWIDEGSNMLGCRFFTMTKPQKMS